VADLRAALEANDSEDFSYGYAFTWWLALELEYGPAKMAEFVAEIEGAASADEVEHALRRVFGISLASNSDRERWRAQIHVHATPPGVGPFLTSLEAPRDPRSR
jgi:hypothetical protein